MDKTKKEKCTGSLFAAGHCHTLDNAIAVNDMCFTDQAKKPIEGFIQMNPEDLTPDQQKCVKSSKDIAEENGGKDKQGERCP